MWIKPSKLGLHILGMTTAIFWVAACGQEKTEEQVTRGQDSASTAPEEILVEVMIPEQKINKSVEEAPSVNTATSYQPTTQPTNVPVANYGAQGFAAGAVPGAAAHHGVPGPAIASAPGVIADVPGAVGVGGPIGAGPIGPGPWGPGPWFGPAFPFPVSDLILVDDDDHRRDDDDDNDDSDEDDAGPAA